MCQHRQPPNGTAQGLTISAERQNKIKQLLEYIRVQFRRLRIYHERISECCASFEFTPVEVRARSASTAVSADITIA